MRRAWRLVWVVSALLVISSPVPADSGRDDYYPQDAGHPLRIVAYVLHPVGVLLDYAIFRPAWTIAGHEPFRTLFGRRAPLSELDLQPTPAPAPASAPEPTP